MLLNNLKAGEKKKRNMKEKKSSLGGTVTKKRNATGGEECLQSRGFSHFNFGLRD